MASVKTQENKSLSASSPVEPQTYIFHCSKYYQRLLKWGTLTSPAKITALLKKKIRIHWMKQSETVRACCIISHSKMHKQSLQKLSESFPDECSYHRPSELCSFFQPLLWPNESGIVILVIAITWAVTRVQQNTAHSRKPLFWSGYSILLGSGRCGFEHSCD